MMIIMTENIECHATIHAVSPVQQVCGMYVRNYVHFEPSGYKVIIQTETRRETGCLVVKPTNCSRRRRVRRNRNTSRVIYCFLIHVIYYFSIAGVSS